MSEASEPRERFVLARRGLPLVGAPAPTLRGAWLPAAVRNSAAPAPVKTPTRAAEEQPSVDDADSPWWMEAFERVPAERDTRSDDEEESSPVRRTAARAPSDTEIIESTERITEDAGASSSREHSDLALSGASTEQVVRPRAPAAPSVGDEQTPGAPATARDTLAARRPRRAHAEVSDASVDQRKPITTRVATAPLTAAPAAPVPVMMGPSPARDVSPLAGVPGAAAGRADAPAEHEIGSNAARLTGEHATPRNENVAPTARTTRSMGDGVTAPMRGANSVDMQLLLDQRPRVGRDIRIDKVSVTVRSDSPTPAPVAAAPALAESADARPTEARIFRNPWSSYHVRRD